MGAKKIVVGVDGSPGSDAALDWAIDEAAALGAEVVAVHVVMPGLRPPGVDLFSRSPDPSFGPLKTSGIEHRILTVHGRPATEILRIADDEDAALVVVGNGLPSTMTEVFLGSVAHELTHHSRRPLAIVPIHSPTFSLDTLGTKQIHHDRVTPQAPERVAIAHPTGPGTEP